MAREDAPSRGASAAPAGVGKARATQDSADQVTRALRDLVRILAVSAARSATEDGTETS